jgi:hypothetical protein
MNEIHGKGLMLTFNHFRKPFNMFNRMSLANRYEDPADGHADEVVEDHQIHGGLGAMGFFHFEVNRCV